MLTISFLNLSLILELNKTKQTLRFLVIRDNRAELLRPVTGQLPTNKALWLVKCDARTSLAVKLGNSKFKEEKRGDFGYMHITHMR